LGNYTGYLTKQPRKAGAPDYIGKCELCGEYRIEGVASGGSIFIKFFEVDPPSAPSLPPKERGKPRPRPKPVPMEKPELVCRTCSKLERCITENVKPDKSFSCFKPM